MAMIMVTMKDIIWKYQNDEPVTLILGFSDSPSPETQLLVAYYFLRVKRRLMTTPLGIS